MTEQRRFPRVEARLTAELAFNAPRAHGSSGESRVPACLRSVSCEGVGVAITGVGSNGYRDNERVVVRVDTGEETLELPGTIARTEHQPDHVFVGIQLMLALTNATTRHRWAEWSVRQIQEMPATTAGRSRTTTPAAGHAYYTVKPRG